MKKSVQRLAELKIRLVSGTDFHEIFTYFMDHFGENDEFIRAGEARHNRDLEQVLVVCAQQILKAESIIIHRGMMVYVKEKQFYHGGGMFNDALVNYFYFEDIDAGLMILALPPALTETMTVRFSLQMLNPPPEPSKN